MPDGEAQVPSRFDALSVLASSGTSVQAGDPDWRGAAWLAAGRGFATDFGSGVALAASTTPGPAVQIDLPQCASVWPCPSNNSRDEASLRCRCVSWIRRHIPVRILSGVLLGPDAWAPKIQGPLDLRGSDGLQLVHDSWEGEPGAVSDPAPLPRRRRQFNIRAQSGGEEAEQTPLDTIATLRLVCRGASWCLRLPVEVMSLSRPRIAWSGASNRQWGSASTAGELYKMQRANRQPIFQGAGTSLCSLDFAHSEATGRSRRLLAVGTECYVRLDGPDARCAYPLRLDAQESQKSRGYRVLLLALHEADPDPNATQQVDEDNDRCIQGKVETLDAWLEMDETRKHADWDASGVLRLLGRWAAGLGKPEARARAQDHHGVRKTSNGAHMACPSQRAWA
ncbi:hypothetical protein PCL_03122 [Purpureocillium lilacinum]|uniref:Uncharacterized protein n=1 Tax=Purpureocillium lilacinum TaxID=33203 RepID=A0A2U3DYN4_PURLI|nr:hypothetical protein Purlil1_563 [Purpureocillium lilacinum]PWI67354.1 hypothetical protein PCL_03122 [Purpureocillium lilacinum]